MSAFILRLDLSDHAQHGDNLPAQHAKVRQWLGLAIQAIGGNSARSGDLTVPIFDPATNTGRHAKVGTWTFTDDDATTSNPKAA